MEGNFTGTPSGIKGSFQVVVNQQSVHGKGTVTGGDTVSGEDVAEHCLELRGGPQLLQDLSQALGGCMKEWRETSQQPTPVEELNHGQWEELQQDGMSDSIGYHLNQLYILVNDSFLLWKLLFEAL